MPGRLFLVTPIATIAASCGHDPAAVANEPPRRSIAPGQEVIVMTNEGLTRMRWGMIPVGRVNARGRPVMDTIVNVRGETLFDKSAFMGTRRCVVPADGWYEWTGSRGRKIAWEISDKDAAPLWFAAICDVWTAPGGLEVPQVATVTWAPNADLSAIHDRMGVILSPKGIQTWLNGDPGDAARLIVPLPDGRLRIRKADGVDWSAP